MWELAANWHGKKHTKHTHTHTRNIHQATSKNVYFGIIKMAKEGGGGGGPGGGGGTLITFWRTSLC